MTQPLPDRWTGVPADRLPPGVRRRYGLDTPTGGTSSAPQAVLLQLGQQAWVALTPDAQAALVQQATATQVVAQLQQAVAAVQSLGADASEAAAQVQQAVAAVQAVATPADPATPDQPPAPGA